MPKQPRAGDKTPSPPPPDTSTHTAEDRHLQQRLRERTAELEYAWRRCRDLFENFPAMSVVTRRGQDALPIIEDCNQRFPSALGYTRDEILGRPLGDFYAPDSQAAPETQPSGHTAERLDGVERQLLDKYGGVLDTMLHLVPTTAPDGSITGTRATYLDITERKREEQKRQEAQSRYRALMEQTLVGICIVQDGSIVYANPKMADISGYTLEEQTAFLSFLDLVAEEDRQAMAQRLERSLAPESEPDTGVVHIRRKDGVTVPLQVQGGPVRSRRPPGGRRDRTRHLRSDPSPEPSAAIPATGQYRTAGGRHLAQLQQRTDGDLRSMRGTARPDQLGGSAAGRSAGHPLGRIRDRGPHAPAARTRSGPPGRPEGAGRERHRRRYAEHGHPVDRRADDTAHLP